MSAAAAPALVGKGLRAVPMRLADTALMLTCLSFVYGSLLVVFPSSFPRLMFQSWESGSITPVMIALAGFLNVGLYLSVAHKRSSKPGMVASGCLGGMPVLVLVGLHFVLQATITRTLSGYIPNAQARVDEEILAHVYFGLIAAVFTPFLLIRLAQQFKQTSS